MARAGRKDDWGFPRWRDYGTGGAAVTQRRCDRYGCDGVGDRPAPKAPNRPERWYFCETHAAEYNSNWNYFEGLTPEEAKAREEAASGESAFSKSQHWTWGGPGDGSRSRAELDALTALELDTDADFIAVKAAHRRLAKLNHPDVAGKSPAAAKRFQAIQAAYEVLSRAEDARMALG